MPVREFLCRRPAMATLFELVLVGEDEEHLLAVGEAALDEVTRLDQVLSRYDPSAELARVNREAFATGVSLSAELFEVLQLCERFHSQTGGWFDPCAGTPVRFGDAVIPDVSTRRVRLSNPETRIDLGGFAKGYALDVAAKILAEFHVENYLMHGGTSSAIARGHRADGRGWHVDLRSPRAGEAAAVATICLKDQALSCSAGETISPTSNRLVTGSCGTVVLAASAAVAEAWSTAVLAMGLDRAREYRYPEVEAVGWIEATESPPTLTWVNEASP